jgi:deazaflavin-dependent oxidoreductase (nitroreductase family)
MRQDVGVFDRSTIKLTHYGRKTGKPYTVTIWFVVMDGRVWIGSLSRKRNWVRNVRARGTADLDFGTGPHSVRFTWVEDPEIFERYSQAVLEKYGWRARFISTLTGWFATVERCVFQTDVLAA